MKNNEVEIKLNFEGIKIIDEKINVKQLPELFERVRLKLL